MNFSKFIRASQDPVVRQKAISGFAERQARREKQFAEDARKRTPGPAWEQRRYDI